ncbi:hypothetical protein GCM10028806_00010 [Spirosoma terrae]|uniref:Uncharacterized protein n=1 Tax=Spirosoma terrae TaxID=1968276 RepID=A0A6L9LJN8_9BACT|nr:hypothetical protein [Spirosoma terrae]NDU96849.1 hypothetical protein [Spirosoma terrae]
MFHCQNNVEWTHSDNDLRYELGIKRGRITSLRELFTSWGILSTRIVRDRDDNKIRAYRINFAELAKPATLQKIYRTRNAKGEEIDISLHSQLFKQLASAQPKADVTPSKSSKKTNYKEYQAKELAYKLEKHFKDRRDVYNAELTKKSNGKPFRLASGTLKFSPVHIKKLANAINAIGDVLYIEHAFIVFCDVLNRHSTSTLSPDHKLLLPQVPRSPLSYFLSYSTGQNSDINPDPSPWGYSVIYAFGEYFAGHYSRVI